MKVILLAGGYGTRLSEYTATIPKPMVPIGGRPMLWHIMAIYASYGHKEFFIALGYKAEVVKEYFLNYQALNSNFSVDLKTGGIVLQEEGVIDWRVTLVDTGLDSMTGGRVKRMQSYIGEETCLMTYGDGLADININELIRFHHDHGKLVTITAVHPIARFGEMRIKDNLVVDFKEKPQVEGSWINGGFLVFEPEFFDFIEDDNTYLEREPLEAVAKSGELAAYHHDGFWQCMDVKRDHDTLENLWRRGAAPWVR
jgi:glucose-1-phosphate cytidylyltransferase